jgi:hypothetical protein
MFDYREILNFYTNDSKKTSEFKEVDYQRYYEIIEKIEDGKRDQMLLNLLHRYDLKKSYSSPQEEPIRSGVDGCTKLIIHFFNYHASSGQNIKICGIPDVIDSTFAIEIVVGGRASKYFINHEIINFYQEMEDNRGVS